jgi:hypothetical protein
MVLFPMPLIAAVKPRLAYMLQETLGINIQIRDTSSMTQLRIWMVILGAIAANGTENRSWYIERLSSLMTMIKGKEYSGFVRTMKRYLWWDYVCQEPAFARGVKHWQLRKQRRKSDTASVLRLRGRHKRRCCCPLYPRFLNNCIVLLANIESYD